MVCLRRAKHTNDKSAGAQHYTNSCICDRRGHTLTYQRDKQFPFAAKNHN